MQCTEVQVKHRIFSCFFFSFYRPSPKTAIVFFLDAIISSPINYYFFIVSDFFISGFRHLMLRSSECLSIIWLLARFVLGGLHLTHSSFLPTALLKVSYHNLFALKSNFCFNVFYLRMNLCDHALPHQEVSATEAQGWLSADFLATATIDQLNKVCLEMRDWEIIN